MSPLKSFFIDLQETSLGNACPIDVEQTCSILSKSSDSRFCSTVQSLIRPCIELFNKKIHQPEERDDDISDRGQLYTLIGLAQFQLLIPTQRVDPTAKYPAKLKQLGGFVESVSDQISVRSKIEQLFTGRSSNDRIETLQKSRDLYEHQISLLSRMVAIRPVPW